MYDYYYYEPSSDEIALSLVITVFVYGIIPLAIALFREEYITRKKYAKACFGFNAIFLVLFIIFGGNGGAPYLIWTTVFWAVGKRMLNNKGILKDNDYEKPAEPYYMSDVFRNSEEMKTKQEPEKTVNAPRNVKDNVSVAPGECVIVDRSREYLVCPRCATRQLSNRGVCYNCGVRFADSEPLEEQ